MHMKFRTLSYEIILEKFSRCYDILSKSNHSLSLINDQEIYDQISRTDDQEADKHIHQAIFDASHLLFIAWLQE
jgi:hypothetical protein